MIGVTCTRTQFVRSESEVHVADAVQQSPQPGCSRRDHNTENEEQIRMKTLERRVSIIGWVLILLRRITLYDYTSFACLCILDRTTDEEQRQYERKRADEVFATWIRVKRLAKRRAQQIANRVEV